MISAGEEKGEKETMKPNTIAKKNVLLILLPFWEPQIPPMGIACIKGHLQQAGYTVATHDANILGTFNDSLQLYFDCLQQEVPAGKRGNFRNIGLEVLRNHMTAYINYTDEQAYYRLINLLVHSIFYTELEHQTLLKLHRIVAEFFQALEKYVLNLLAGAQFDVLGLSVFKGNLAASLFTFRLTREKYPHINTVMGGAVFAGTLTPDTPDFEHFLRQTKGYIDKLIVGEGEQIFLKWLEGELDENKRVYTLKDIDNQLLDLSRAVMPDFSDLQLQYYPNMASFASRSCPFQCSFCTETVYWGKYRKKSPQQVVKELSRLYDTHNYQLFLMCDSLLNPIITPLAYAMIEAEKSIYWDGYLRVDQHGCDPGNVFQWRRGGFYRARLGLESGSPHVLDIMGKQITIQQVKTVLENLADAGIKTTTYWVIGHPGETEEDFQQTLDLIEELKESIYEAWCAPFYFYLSGQAGTDLWTGQKVEPLYPLGTRDMLLLRTWTMDCEPSREEMYKRVNRFVAHCKNIGIANPYTLLEIAKADQRWQKLHRNAVPPLLQFRNNEETIDENRYVKQIIQAQSKLDIQPEEALAFDF
jgi:hypothetical protein